MRDQEAGLTEPNHISRLHVKIERETPAENFTSLHNQLVEKKAERGEADLDRSGTMD
jgi:hypothetical protein